MDIKPWLETMAKSAFLYLYVVEFSGIKTAADQGGKDMARYKDLPKSLAKKSHKFACFMGKCARFYT